MVQVEHLHKYYNKGKKNEQHVLDDINLEFGQTGLVCILGESGSGKTTLLNTIGGLDDFAEGTLTVDGTTLTGYQPRIIEPIRNEHYGYIFQNYYILQDYSVEYNVKLALNRYDLTEEEKEERTEYILGLLGMAKYKNKLVSKLSGGQQQRVSIARALVKAPDIILADEPTGNLDEENTIRTMSILKSISKECLVLLVTHEKRIARFFGDRIIEIRDGRVVRDVENTGSSYERSDDANIYLPEYEKKSLEEGFAKFHMYYQPEEEAGKVCLNLVWKDEKLYIQNLMDCDIVLEGEENGIHVLDEERPKLNIEDIEQFSYDLERLPSQQSQDRGDAQQSSGVLPQNHNKGAAKLPFREIWRMALSNTKMMGRKQAFMITILLASAILLSVTLAKFINMVAINEEAVVSVDSHYVSLNFDIIATLNDTDGWEVYNFLYNYLDNADVYDPFFAPSAKLYLTGQGYLQLGDVQQTISGFSYVSLSHLKGEQLVYGRMPEKRNEVVVDMSVIEDLMDSKGALTSYYKKPEEYLGVILEADKGSSNMEITGISNTQEPSIYCGQNILLSMVQKGYEIASVEEFLAEYPDEYEMLKLASDEVLMREGMYNARDTDGMSASSNQTVVGNDLYNIVGTFPDELEVDYILSDEGCKNIRNEMIYQEKSCLLYTDDIDKTMQYFKDLHWESDKFALNLKNMRDVQLQDYLAKSVSDTDAGNLITLIVVVISVLMIYFTVKSNAMSRSEELTVYRLLGISRGSIIQAYVLEMAILTSVTSLPAVLVSSGVIKFIGSIPSLEMGMLFPWWSVLLLLAVIYAVHTIISILPVHGIISKPPATLAVKG